MPVNDDELLARAKSRSMDFAWGAGLKSSDMLLIRELETELRAAVAARPQPLFEAVVKTTMPSSLHMDGTHPVTLAAWADTETLRQVKGQRVVVYPAVAGSATPTGDQEGD